MSKAATDRIQQDIATLSTFNDTPKQGVTRFSYTPQYRAAQAYVRSQMEAAGLCVSLDAMGNLVGRKEGSEPGLGALAMGSHLDSVRCGGRFDGAMGVVCGLEVARMLQENGTVLRHPFEVVAIAEEEGNSFGSGILGGKAFAGILEQETLHQLKNAEGVSAFQAMQEYGLHPENLAQIKKDPSKWAFFLEPHIEQGPVLESEGLSVGVVEAIVGIRTRKITITGRPDHGGTTPMHLRLDAVVAAARIVRLVDDAAKGLADGTVTTCGSLKVEPGTLNVVPGRVEMTVDCRSSRQASIDAVTEQLNALLEMLGKEGYTVQSMPLMEISPVRLSERGIQALTASLAENGLPEKVLPSGAGHDSMYIAGVTEVGMLFARSKGGRSHCPEEFTRTEDIADCCNVAYTALLHLDNA